MRSRRICGALALAIGVALAGPAAAVTPDPPGTVTVPAADSALAPFVYAEAVSGSAFAYVAETVPGVTEVVYRAAGASTDAAPITVPGATISNPTITGTTLTFASLDGTTNTELVHRVDMTTGDDTTFPLRLDNSKSELYLGATSTGFVLDVATSATDSLVLRQIGGSGTTTDQTLASFPATGNSALTDVAAVDDAGVAYVVGTFTDTTATDQLTYRTYGSSATPVKVGAAFSEDSGGISAVALSPQDVVWSAGTKILRTPRAGGAVTSFTLPFGDDTVDAMAATDTLTAWVAENDSIAAASVSAPAVVAGRGSARAHQAFVRRSATQRLARRFAARRAFAASGDDTVPDADAGYIAAANGSGRKVIAGTRFISSLTADVTSADGSPIVAAIGFLAGSSTLSTVDSTGAATTLERFAVPIAATISLALGQGRLASADTRALDLRLVSRPVSEASGTLALGSETTLPSGSSPQAVQVSGDRVADIEFVGSAAVPQLVIRRDSVVERRIRLSDDFISYKLSGGYLLLFGGLSTHLMDLSTGALSKAPDNSDLWGQQLVWTDSRGALWRRDLALPSSSHNPRKVHADQCSSKLPGCVFGMVTWGDWATYTIFGATTVQVVLFNMRTGHSYTLSKSSGTDSGIPLLAQVAPVLVDGAYVTDPDGTLEDIDLTHPTDLGGKLVLHPVADTLGQFAADEGLASWVGLDGKVRVAPLPNDTTSGPRLFSFPATGAFSPNGDGAHDTWRGEFDTTRPLSSATVQIRNGAGQVVRTLAAGVSAPEATVRVSWDGRDSAGRRLPDATYMWSFSGTGSGGTGSVTRTGRIAIHRSAPHARVKGVALSTAVSASPSFRVHWLPTTAATAAYRVSSYDVRYRKHIRSGGHWRWSAWHPWLTRTGKTSATFAGTAGHTYYFAVRPHDNAGNVGPWSSAELTTVPYDDGSSGMHYAGGWSARRHAHGWFRSTVHETSAAGATLSYRQVGSRVEVIGGRSSGGGSFTVYVDGRRIGIVSTHARKRHRRTTLFTQRFPGRLRTHTVKIVTGGAGPVAIDGIAFVR